MEDESKFGNMVKLGLGAVGLGGVAAVITVPSTFKIWVAVAILVLFFLFFGGYFLWRRLRARRQSKMFSSALEAQTGAAPRAISDPNQRAALDKLRQKFQAGMQEFKTHGKDIYKLPWYAIIGESGSGKSEAIRHSGIEFPPGLQDKMQGSGGTVNMDWWFTNRAIILDTAGSMIFRETQAGDAPEWGEFLRLLKKSRPQCPINGLFLVLSVESLIHDSADKIGEKASKLAQQLQLIQRTLDVRFPVYLLVTKSDLLTGFREFFDNIEDPLLQHQMFGWSNPDALDAPLRPELVEQHLKSLADRLRRRRLALILRETTSAGKLGDTSFFSASQPLGGRGGQRRLDDMDALFALPESVMRLVPRLRRYLETVFVAGEWSAKPVFLRGVYFTSSMREGKALDEAMALATGLSVDQLPEDRSWEKNRAFFLRDLFVEKVFSESGLVTRATNTIQLLRKRQFAIFGTAGVAMLLLLGFGFIGRGKLADSVGTESRYWAAGTNGWNGGEWSQAIVRERVDGRFQFDYAGTNLIKVGEENLTLLEYHSKLKQRVLTDLPTPLLFLPLKKLSGQLGDRKQAQRILFEQGVIRPLVLHTRNKMRGMELDVSDSKAVERHREALLTLIRFETDRFAANKGIEGTNRAVKYLSSFLSYLTDSDTTQVDTNLVEVFAWTYSKGGSGDKMWPPEYLLGGNALSNNLAIRKGLEDFKRASRMSQASIETNELPALNAFTDALDAYQKLETNWFAITDADDACAKLTDGLSKAIELIETTRRELLKVAKNIETSVTNLAFCYLQLAAASSKASEFSFSNITSGLPETEKTKPDGLVREIQSQLMQFNKEAASAVNRESSFRSKSIALLDTDYLASSSSNATAAFQLRSLLYSRACLLKSDSVAAGDESIGDGWQKFTNLTSRAAKFKQELEGYRGAYATMVLSACDRIAGQAERQLKEENVTNYVRYVTNKLQTLAREVRTFRDVTNARVWLDRVKSDLTQRDKLGEQAGKLGPVGITLTNAYRDIPQNYASSSFNSLKQTLKFPLALNSFEFFDEQGLKAVRKALGNLTDELGDEAVWQSFPGSEAILESARKNPYADVVNALIASNGTLAEIEIFFTLPAPETTSINEGQLYRKQLWYANVVINGNTKAISGGKRPGDVSSFPVAQATSIAAKIPVNSGFRVEFFSDRDKQHKTATLGFEGSEDNWTLIRLIKAGQAEQINNKGGEEWRLKIPVLVGGNSLTLEAFTIRVNSPLPKKADWPK